MSIKGYLESLGWWFYVKVGSKLRFRINKRQKQALADKIPMTEDLFWSCLDTYYLRHEMEKFWEVWNRYPEYADAFLNTYDKETADAWWTQMRRKLVDAFGEEWVKENYKNIT